VAFSQVRAKGAEAQGYACSITKELKVMKSVLCLLVMLVGPLHVYSPSKQTMQITQASSVAQEIVKPAPQSQERCTAAPSKSSLKQILGAPVKCPSSVEEERECFRPKQATLVTVQLNSSDKAPNIFIYENCNGIHGLTDLISRVVPKSMRGKFLKRVEKKPLDTNYVEEYECLRMEYFQDIGHGCAPASVNIDWE
jgi:hypothetical protein